MAIAFPTGLRADGLTKIIPGAYAIVGMKNFQNASVWPI